MSDLINRQAAIDHWRSIIDATDGGNRYDIGFNDGLEFCISDLSTMPSAQPTLYGYEIEHLAYIAMVMQKEGVTAEYAVRTFDDMTRMSRMIIEELQEKVEKSLSAMQLSSVEPEIIRCKDCRYTDEDGVCQSSKGIAIQDDDDYCSQAERREG